MTLPMGVPPRASRPPTLQARPSAPSLRGIRSEGSLSPLPSDALSRARRASADGRTLSTHTHTPIPLSRPPPRTDDPAAADGSDDPLGPVVDVDTLLARRMYAACRA